MLESGLVTNFYHICIISKCVTFEVTFFLNINLVIPVLSEKNHFASKKAKNPFWFIDWDIITQSPQSFYINIFLIVG